MSEYESRRPARPGGNTTFVWQGKKDNMQLWISRRPDRHGIVILFQRPKDMSSKEKQICMCSTNTFDDELAEDKFLKAERVMVEVAKLFAAGVVDLDGLYKCRDQQVKNLYGIVARLRKRPAASGSSSATTGATKAGRSGPAERRADASRSARCAHPSSESGDDSFFALPA